MALSLMANPFIYLLHWNIISGFMRMGSAFSGWYLWICSDCALASVDTLAIMSSKGLEVWLTADEDLPGSWPHQFKATNAQHKCILKAHIECEHSFHFEATMSMLHTVHMKNDRFHHWNCLGLEEKTQGLLLIVHIFAIAVSWWLP